MKITFLNEESRRTCGECTLCCKLLPVPSLNKGAGQRCKFQRLGKGCSIYASRPLACKGFSCRWLVEDDTADLSRPDRVHYVIDQMPDFVTMEYPDDEPVRLPVMQIWVDPRHPDAHRDPALRAYLARRGAEGFAALIRYDSTNGFLLIAPTLSGKPDWIEERTTNVGTEPNDPLDVLRELSLGPS